MRKLLYAWLDSPDKNFWRAWTAFWLAGAILSFTAPLWWPR